MKRVTEIIWEVYPFFEGTFKDSLSPAGIKKKKEKWLLIPWGKAERYGQLDYDTTMEELCQLGTYLGQYFVDHINGEFIIEREPLKPFTDGIKTWIHDNNPVLLDYNSVVKWDDYEGSLDIILEIPWKDNTKETWLIDIKTYDAYKYLNGIKDDIIGKRGKPLLSSSNKKKVTLQTSMYRNAYTKYPIDKQWVLWVTQYGSFLFELDYNLDDYIKWQRQQEDNIYKNYEKTLYNTKGYLLKHL